MEAFDYRVNQNQYIASLKEEEVPEEYKLLLQTVGLDAFKKLIILFGGVTLYINTPKTFVRTVRDKKVVDDYEKGLSYSEIAVKHNITDRWVREIVKKTKGRGIANDN
ncbi:MAG TPA: hypothetical protein DD738_15715 [Ruminiclostridium sp.]|jgi:Mor family transcriptional regulator|nr:hypothetical protein [Bacillota bacterium]HBR04046.1 hypothetical protein [Ruminiclostridium sp.]